jgi:hypothetical protein
VITKLRTALSGNDFAVELTELVNPPLAPAPVMKLQNTTDKKVKVDMVVAPSGIPASKKSLRPEYPVKSRMNAPMSGISGPLVSTIRPHIGPQAYTPSKEVISL